MINAVKSAQKFFSEDKDRAFEARVGAPINTSTHLTDLVVR